MVSASTTHPKSYSTLSELIDICTNNFPTIVHRDRMRFAASMIIVPESYRHANNTTVFTF